MPDAYDNLSREELQRAAAERGIELRPGLTRARLVALLRDADARAVHGDAPAAPGAGEAQMEAARAKFDLRPDAPAPAPHDIPWGYGETRITAMARDPEFLYAYWEVTDESVADARAKLGAGGPGAFCVLRVYDTTLRHFDGTNANSYFDATVDRAWNSYFLRVDRPGAAFHVDIGLKSQEGFFAVMARSGPAEMPAAGMSGDDRVEWMTVQTGQQPPGPLAYRHRFTPRPAPPWVGRPPGAGHAGAGNVSWSWTSAGSGASWEIDFERVLAALVGGEAAQQGEWVEQVMGGRVVRWLRWAGTRRRFSWRSGPVGASLPAGMLGPIEIWFEGRRHVLHAGDVPAGGVRYEYGPWYVVIAGDGPQGERRVFDTWVVRVAWSTGGGLERVESPMIYRRILGAYRRRILVAGASEMLVREEMGASEELLAGASERLWLSASETLAAGASESFALGASERFGLGASEQRWGGASGIAWGGASIFAFAGASERLGAGASENLFGGASPAGGASEGLFGRASDRVSGVARGEDWSGFAVLPPAPGVTGGADVSAVDVLPRVTGPARQAAMPAGRRHDDPADRAQASGAPARGRGARGPDAARAKAPPGRGTTKTVQLELFETKAVPGEAAGRAKAPAAQPPRSARPAARPSPGAKPVRPARSAKPASKPAGSKPRKPAKAAQPVKPARAAKPSRPAPKPSRSSRPAPARPPAKKTGSSRRPVRTRRR
jgi:hypothetical protein